MKRQIRVSTDSKSIKHDIYSVPNIDNRVTDVTAVLSWLDKLVEVRDNAENISNK